jgi:membrane protein
VLNRLWLLTKRTVQEYGDDNCSHMAAAISYYVLFSIVPLTIFTISIFGFVVRDAELQQDVSSRIVDFLNVEKGVPIFVLDEDAITELYGEDGFAEIEAANDRLSETEVEPLAAAIEAGRQITLAGRALDAEQVVVSDDNLVTETIEGIADVSGPLTIVGLVGMAWAGSALFGAVRRSLNIAWDIEVKRPFVRQKLVDLSLVLGLGILLGASLAGTAALRTLQKLSDDNLGPLSDGSGIIWSIFPLFLPAVLTFIVFLVVYQYVPNFPTPFRDVWPGAAVATVLFQLLTNLYALYIVNFNNYAGAYGALGGLLLFLLWTYLTSNILLVGAEIAAEYPRVMRGDYDNLPKGPPRTLTENVRRLLRNLVFNPFDDDEEEKTTEEETTGEGEDSEREPADAEHLPS